MSSMIVKSGEDEAKRCILTTFPFCRMCCVVLRLREVRLIDMEPRKRWELAKEASSKYVVALYVTVLSDKV